MVHGGCAPFQEHTRSKRNESRNPPMARGTSIGWIGWPAMLAGVRMVDDLTENAIAARLGRGWTGCAARAIGPRRVRVSAPSDAKKVGVESSLARKCGGA